MILTTGAGLPLALASGLLAGGVAVFTGAASGGSALNDLAHKPETAITICDYAAPSVPATGTGGLTETGLDATQTAAARTIVQTAAELRLPKRAAIIAIATALQESDLGRNLIGDHGTSFGLFHQKPTSGYGTRHQILNNPRRAARAFYTRLTRLPNWQTMPLTQAAQTIQKSSTPTAYAKHETRATQIVNKLGSPSPVPYDSQIGKETSNRIRSGLILAAADDLPRDKALAKISKSLRRSPSKSSNDQTVAQQIQAQADRLCTELTQTSPNGAVPLTGSGSGALAVRAALTQLGVPYSWGGGGPNGPTRGIGRGASTTGFDCSGLAEYAWAKAGARIGTSTAPQWRSGVRVPRDQLRPGDLLFFARNPKDPSTIHHVGINLDGKRMIHAPRTGKTVEVARWAGTPYREREFIGAIRPAATDRRSASRT